MIPVVAVREWSWKLLVTYGVSVFTTPEEKESMNSMIQMLVKMVLALIPDAVLCLKLTAQKQRSNDS